MSLLNRWKFKKFSGKKIDTGSRDIAYFYDCFIKIYLFGKRVLHMVSSLVNLEELFQTDGVIAVAKLDDMGRITDWKAKGVVNPELTKGISTMSAEVDALFTQFARNAPRNWSPRRAWIYTGGDMTMIASGGAAVTVENKKENFEKLFKIFGLFGF